MSAPRSGAARFVWSAALLALLAGARQAGAHPADFSSFYAEREGKFVRVVVDLHPKALVETLPALDTDHDGQLSEAEVAASSDALTTYLATGLALDGDGAPCPATLTEPPRLAAATRVQLQLRYDCPRVPATLTWRVRAFTEVQGGHSVLGRTRMGSVYDQWLFAPGAGPHEVTTRSAPAPAGSAATPPPAEPAAPGRFAAFGGFLRLGVLHILGGVDHLLFVGALVLAVRRFRELAIVVTSFTLAHSVTLALGALDLVHAPVRLVESIISLSIVWVGVDNVLHAEPRHRPRLAFGFGLLHGLGFSTALREIGLPPRGLASALLGFNLGVEAGQLAVVAPAFLLLAALVRGRTHERAAVRALSGAIAACGCLWLADRALGLGMLP